MDTFGAILYIIFIKPIKYLFTHKIALLLIIVGVVVAIAIGSQNKPQAEASTPGIQAAAPTVAEAPYLLQTSSRLYYVVDYKDDNRVITLSSYYYYDKEKWALSEAPLDIDRKYYGAVNLVVR